MVEGILAAGHVAVDAAEGAGGEGRVEVEGVGADLDLDALLTHTLKNFVSVGHINTMG